MFSQAHPAAPGELMEIDSTPLDVLVLLDDGVPGWVELTGLIDVATRTVPAAVLRPSTRSVDASVLLARALTPGPMRPDDPSGDPGQLQQVRKFASLLSSMSSADDRAAVIWAAVPSWPDKPATVHIQVIPVSISRRAAGADVTAASFSVQSNGEAPLGPSAGRLRGNTRP